MKSSHFRHSVLLLAATSVITAIAASEAGAQRLSTRPHQMVLGTRTAQAGQYLLDAYDDSVYVPPKAVGEKRVPLVVAFGSGVEPFRALSDQFGMIFMTVSDKAAHSQDPRAFAAQSGRRLELAVLDSALQKVLRTYAIDPDKIAMVGLSNGGNYTLELGCQNLDIFSRLAPLSSVPAYYPPCSDTARPMAARTQMFVSIGIGEPAGGVAGVLALAPPIARDGHPMQLVLNLREHAPRVQDYGYVWQWLHDSWASTTPPKYDRGESVTSLTTDVLTKMTTFWSGFRKNHPVVTQGWPTVNEKTVTVPVGMERMVIFDMADIGGIAAKEAAVADALKTTGLTVPQEEAYRAALIGARATLYIRKANPTFAAIPAVEQNVTFLQAHLDETNALLDLMAVPRCEIGIQEKFRQEWLKKSDTEKRQFMRANNIPDDVPLMTDVGGCF